MAKKKTVAEQTQSGQVNSFTGGLNTDLHPMLQPNDTLTDCLNGTLITYNGNENMLQNDMGNYELKYAQLPEGYIPMGMKEHQGILYIASWNPFEKRAQIGSYPSPKTRYGDGVIKEYSIDPLEINELEINKDVKYYINGEEISVWEFRDENDTEGYENKESVSKLIFSIVTGIVVEKLQDNIKVPVTKNYQLSKIDASKSEIIFTDSFSEETSLGMGDRYQLDVAGENFTDDFQTFKYFIIDKDKNKHDVTESVFANQKQDSEFDDIIVKENLDDLVPVTFDYNGWLGAKYELNPINTSDVDISIVENN